MCCPCLLYVLSMSVVCVVHVCCMSAVLVIMSCFPALCVVVCCPCYVCNYVSVLYVVGLQSHLHAVPDGNSLCLWAG